MERKGTMTDKNEEIEAGSETGETAAEVAIGKPDGRPAGMKQSRKEKTPDFEADADKGFTVSWKTCMRIVVTVLVIGLLVYFWAGLEQFLQLLLGGMLAVFAGLVIAYIVNLPMRFFEEKLPGPTGDGTKNRALSLAFSYACAVIVLVFLAILVIPNLVGAIVALAESAPGVMDSLEHNEFLMSILPPGFLEQIKSIDWEKVVNDIAAWAQAGITDSLPEIFSAIGKVGACFMGIILSFWFLGEKNKLSGGAHTLVKTYIGKGADEWLSGVLAVADRSFRGYFKGAALEAVIFGTIVTLGATLIGTPYAPMLGALVGIMSLIPMVGALIGAVLGAIIILPSSWQHALIFLVVFFVIQQIEANFIYPRVVGKHAGLTGMWPLVGVTLGAAVFGFVGAVIGVPLIATIHRLVEADMKRREETGDELSPIEKLKQSL